MPDNYEVIDTSLFDIKYNMNPTFTKEQISLLDEQVIFSKTLEGEDFMPGFVGLNNLKQTDYINVVLQMMNTISPLRNYALLYKDNSEIRSDLTGILATKLSELIRKIWNPRNFKGHVNPHEFVQALSDASSKLFKIGEQKEPISLFSWLLNSLHGYFLTKKKSNILAELMRGSLQIFTSQLAKTKDEKITKSNIEKMPDFNEKPFWYFSKINFFRFLSLDLPSVPLYKGENGGLLTIPQVYLEDVFKKFDGKTPTDDTKNNQRNLYRILKLPKYLILAVKRFVKNEFFTEKNNTLIMFPLKDIDLSNCIFFDNFIHKKML